MRDPGELNLSYQYSAGIMRQDNAPDRYDDLALVEQVSREFLAQLGARAVPFLQELTELAEGSTTGIRPGHGQTSQCPPPTGILETERPD